MKTKISRDTAIAHALGRMDSALSEAARQSALLKELFRSPKEFNTERAVKDAWRYDCQNAVIRIVNQIGAEEFLRAVVSSNPLPLVGVKGVGPITLRRLTSEVSVKLAKKVLDEKAAFVASET